MKKHMVPFFVQRVLLQAKTVSGYTLTIFPVCLMYATEVLKQQEDFAL